MRAHLLLRVYLCTHAPPKATREMKGIPRRGKISCIVTIVWGYQSYWAVRMEGWKATWPRSKHSSIRRRL